MKINLVCGVCLFNKTPHYQCSKLIDVSDSRAYPFTCDAGHDTIVFLSDFKFQILFEIGVNAIVDGYYRESVSSFTSALERFYEHFIKTVLYRKDGSEHLGACWKKVSNQSERQLGAFIFLYLNELGELPEILSQSNTTFRNEVVHKGKIPTKEKAIGYGDAITKLILPVYKKLVDNYWDETCDLLFSADSEIKPEHQGRPTFSQNITAYLSNPDQTMNFEDYIKSLEPK